MAWTPSRSRRVDARGGGTPWWEEKHFNLHLSHVFQKCGSFVLLSQLYHRVGGCREGGRREHLWRSSWQGALQAPPGTTPWRSAWGPTWRPPWRSTWRSTWRPPCPAAPSSVPAEYSASATSRPDPGKLPVTSTFQIAPKFHFPACKKAFCVRHMRKTKQQDYPLLLLSKNDLPSRVLLEPFGSRRADNFFQYFLPSKYSSTDRNNGKINDKWYCIVLYFKVFLQWQKYWKSKNEMYL